MNLAQTKGFIFGFLALISLSANCQNTKNPNYYINSKKVDPNKLLINTKNIDSVRIEKKTENGEIHIFTKNRDIKYLSIGNVLAKYAKQNILPNSYVIEINGKVVNDTTNLQIDSSFFIYFETMDLSGVKYLNGEYLDLKIVDIKLEPEERKQNIILKGKNDSIPDEVNNILTK